MWNPPKPGKEHVSCICRWIPKHKTTLEVSSAGGFLNTGPLWKSPIVVFGFFYHKASEILVPLTGIELKPSAVTALSPNHWPTWKFLIITERQSRIEIIVKIALNISHLSSSQYAMVLMMYEETNKTRKKLICKNWKKSCIYNFMAEHFKSVWFFFNDS